MRTRTRVRRRTARRAPTVRRCGCGGRAQTDAKQRMSDTREAGLMIGGAKDPAETRADAAAGGVMSGGSVPVAHRTCAECATEGKEDKTAHREASGAAIAPGTASTPASAGVENAVSSMNARRALSDGERAFFEPRFGRDFSDVRVHEDASADRAAKGMDAAAFTVGKDIGIAKGEYERSGPALMAHELAHVTDEGERTARRLVRANSVCPTTVPGTPATAADVTAAIAAADSMAMDMARNASGLMMIALLNAGAASFRTDPTYTTYTNWFRAPPQLPNGRFRARLGGGTHATEQAAVAVEMQAMMRRYDRIARWFGRDIRYRCPNLARFTIPGCAAARCGGGDAAQSCPTGTRQIVLCNGFWGFADVKIRASLLIHEAFHAALHLRTHPTATARRLNNPACNGGFVRALFNVGGLTAPQCPTP